MVYFHKVKAHDSDFWNNTADRLANEGIYEGNILIDDKLFTNNVTTHFFNINIDTNIRHFFKDIFTIKNDIKFENLNRVQSILKSSKNDNQFNLNWSKSFTNFSLPKNIDNNTVKPIHIPPRFLNMRRDKEKSFKIKILFDELPVMEKLKVRNPKTYLSTFKCPRCTIHNETIEHLWNCSKANNDVVFLQLNAREFIKNLIHQAGCFSNIDDLLQKLFKYTKTTKNLKKHTAERARFYKQLNNHYSFKLEYIYIWDSSFSLDNLIKGWIPHDLTDILLSHMKVKSIKKVKNILAKWIARINQIFLESIWKSRNNDMKKFEEEQKIKKSDKIPTTRKPKLTRNGLRNTNRTRRINRITCANIPPDDDFNDIWYDRVKILMGFNSNIFYPFYSAGDKILFFRFLFWRHIYF